MRKKGEEPQHEPGSVRVICAAYCSIVKTWTKILYKDFTVRIQNNGNFSPDIDILKGVHQGGCCSSLYFLVIAEILALTLRANENIEGITLQDIRNLLNQFADDTDIFSLCTEKSIKTIFEELEKFKWQSGFTVSYEKTTVYRIGSKEWIKFFTSTPPQTYMPIPPHNYDQLIAKETMNFSQRVYKFLSEDITLVHSKYIKWRQKLEELFTETLWEFRYIHLDILKVTNIAKYRSFQYRLVQWGIVTNVQLHKWKLIENDLCTFCGEETETIQHLFFNCSIVKELWKEVLLYLEQYFGIKITNFTSKAVIFNQIVPKRKVHIGNFICLITKYYIYCQHCFKDDLNFHHLKRKLKQIENMEKYIAIKNCRLFVHNRKWSISDSAPNAKETSSYSNQNEEDFILEYIGKM